MEASTDVASMEAFIEASVATSMEVALTEAFMEVSREATFLEVSREATFMEVSTQASSMEASAISMEASMDVPLKLLPWKLPRKRLWTHLEETFPWKLP